MSAFWDSIKADVKPYPGKTATNTVTLESVWDSIPEQSLVELDSDCVHHFTIPTGSREVIGQCMKCNGERWFNNYADEFQFNRSPKTTTEQLQAYADAEQHSNSAVVNGAMA